MQRAGQHEIGRQRPGMGEARADRGEQQRGEQLHERIAHGNARPAVPAPAPQPQPREQRDVVAVLELHVAARAVRRRPHERLVAGHAPDHDVQERTDDESVQAADRGDQRSHDDEPRPRSELRRGSHEMPAAGRRPDATKRQAHDGPAAVAVEQSSITSLCPSRPGGCPQPGPYTSPRERSSYRHRWCRHWHRSCLRCRSTCRTWRAPLPTRSGRPEPPPR